MLSLVFEWIVERFEDRAVRPNSRESQALRAYKSVWVRRSGVSDWEGEMQAELSRHSGSGDLANLDATFTDALAKWCREGVTPRRVKKRLRLGRLESGGCPDDF